MAVQGYPKLANHVSTSPSSLITRSFASLAARNIFYLQAELVHLEMKLQELESRDSSLTVGKRGMYAKDWYWLHSSAMEQESEQWDTVLQMRAKLKDYYDAVLQQAAVSNLPRPVTHDLHELQSWLARRAMGDMALIGEDRKVWGYADGSVTPASDLIAINPVISKDPFSNWAVHIFMKWIYRRALYPIKKVNDVEAGILVYEEETVLRWSAWISTVIASLLPIISTIALYFVVPTGLRLGLTVIFTFLFALALMTFTTARSMDVFIATAAFAAVEVVFISGTE